MNTTDLITSLKDCPCGRDHGLPLPVYLVEADIAGRLPGLLDGCGLGRRLHLVGDRATFSVYGNLSASLAAAGFQISQTCFDDMRNATLEAAERIIAEIKAAPGRVSGILAIGSGSINDLSRYAAFTTGLPYAILATAPSMDGFTSTVSPLVMKGFKRTIAAVGPRGVFADPAILAEAPVALKAAGFGDLLGKFTALADWEIIHRLTGEYWCPRLAALVRQALDLACAQVERIAVADEAAAVKLMDALVLSGYAMLLVGNSRPASGAEHHLSHLWEMRYLAAGRPQEFHGTKVGVATLELAPVYAALANLSTPPALTPTPDAAAIRAVFGPLADEVIKENSPDPMSAIDPARLAAEWPAIRRVLQAIPAVETLRSWLVMAGGHASARDLGIPEAWISEALRWAPLVRSRLSVLRLFGPA